MNFFTIGIPKRRFFCAALIASICFSASAQDQKAKAAIYRVGDRLLEVRKAVYTEDLPLTKGFLEEYNRLQNVVSVLVPEVIRLHLQFNPESESDVKKEIERHLDGLAAAQFYETQPLRDNPHAAVMEQESSKVAYLENRICYMMRMHFGEDEDFKEWAGKWQKEFPLGLPEVGEAKGFSGESFENDSFKIHVQNRAPEGHVTSDDVHFEVIEIQTGKSIKGKGNTVHTHDEEGTPKRFLGYEFETDGIHYFIGRFGRFEMTDENGKTIESLKLKPAHEL